MKEKYVVVTKGSGVQSSAFSGPSVYIGDKITPSNELFEVWEDTCLWGEEDEADLVDKATKFDTEIEASTLAGKIPRKYIDEDGDEEGVCNRPVVMTVTDATALFEEVLSCDYDGDADEGNEEGEPASSHSWEADWEAAIEKSMNRHSNPKNYDDNTERVDSVINDAHVTFAKKYKTDETQYGNMFQAWMESPTTTAIKTKFWDEFKAVLGTLGFKENPDGSIKLPETLAQVFKQQEENKPQFTSEEIKVQMIKQLEETDPTERIAFDLFLWLKDNTGLEQQTILDMDRAEFIAECKKRLFL